ncbi:MAG: sll1863 family stress response protein [Burkholderiaceae bacterium]
MSTKDEYVERMKQQLDELNGAMYNLEAGAREVKENVRDKYKIEIRKLRQQSQINMDMLDVLKSASEDTWEAAVAGAEMVRDAFVHSLHDFKSQSQ